MFAITSGVGNVYTYEIYKATDTHNPRYNAQRESNPVFEGQDAFIIKKNGVAVIMEFAHMHPCGKGTFEECAERFIMELIARENETD